MSIIQQGHIVIFVINREKHIPRAACGLGRLFNPKKIHKQNKSKYTFGPKVHISHAPIRGQNT